MFHNCQLERDDILVVNLVMTSQLRSGMYSQKEKPTQYLVVLLTNAF